MASSSRYVSDAGKVFIRNFNQQISDDEFIKPFKVFGNIVDWKVAKDLQGKSTGNGYVHFETEEAAKICIKACNGVIWKDNIIYVEKYNLFKENEEEMSDKEKVVIGFKMAVRNSIFKSYVYNPDTMQSEVKDLNPNKNQEQSLINLKQEFTRIIYPMVEFFSESITNKITKYLMDNISDFSFMVEGEKAIETKIINLILEIEPSKLKDLT